MNDNVLSQRSSIKNSGLASMMSIPSPLSSEAYAAKKNDRLKDSHILYALSKDITKTRSWSGPKLRSFNAHQTHRASWYNNSTPHHSPFLTTPIQRMKSSAGGDIAANRHSERYKSGLSRNRQEQRLREELSVIYQSHRMNQALEMGPHRQDVSYYICGSRMPLLNRYIVSESELQRQHAMKEASNELKLDLTRKYPYFSRIPKPNKNKSREKTDDKISHKNGDTVDEAAALKTSIPDETEPVALKPKSQQIGERIPPINATSAEASRNDDYLLSHYSEISSSPQSLQSRGVSDDKIIKENT
ncbi:uncharacterized protein LOC112576571 isoform X1 [Pomacea canaliculata]|nr:uncharacterized protein LOC112576571 isoform X1 [Pomacea canaliculata]